MNKFKELRIVLDLETHSKFKSEVCKHNKSMKQTILDLIDKYIKESKN